MTAEPRALQEIIDADDQPVFALDRDLCYTAFNRAHATMMRELYGAEIALGGRLTDYQTVAADRETALANLERALAGEPVVASAYSGEPGRERRYFDVRHTPLRDDDGAVSGVVMHAVDITERRRAEDEIRRLNTDLERRESERTRELTAANADLEDFVYSIAHDLRSPLRALSGFSELVQTDCGHVIDDTGRDYLRRIHDAAQHLGELMDALLSLSKVSRRDLDLRDVDLSALARGVAKQLRDAGPERAAAFEIEDGLVAHGDPALCGIVVQNLLGNAWKFSAGESPARISFGAQRVDGRRVYCVRDNGVGFDPQYSGKLFTPFERLHTAEEFPGTGIGLATVRRAVTRLGGRCWADSEPGCGAQAYFTLGEPC